MQRESRKAVIMNAYLQCHVIFNEQNITSFRIRGFPFPIPLRLMNESETWNFQFQIKRENEKRFHQLKINDANLKVYQYNNFILMSRKLCFMLT